MIDSGSGSKKATDTLTVLRRHIVDGDWPINTRIPKEPELMALLGVGKSTVREAVRTLANFGMLETVRGVGTFVRSRTPAMSLLRDSIADFPIEEVLVYRRALEVEAAQQAAVRRTPEQVERLRASLAFDRAAAPDSPRTPERGETPGPFHHLLLEAAGTPLLASVYAGVMEAVRAALRAGELTHGSDHATRQRDHQVIIDAIEAQDVARAAHAMALHVDRDLVPVDAAPPSPIAAASLGRLARVLD